MDNKWAADQPPPWNAYCQNDPTADQPYQRLTHQSTTLSNELRQWWTWAKHCRLKSGPPLMPLYALFLLYYSVHSPSTHFSHPPSSWHTSIHPPISAKLQPKNGKTFQHSLLSPLSHPTVFQAFVLVTTLNSTIPYLPPLIPPFSTMCICTHPFPWTNCYPPLTPALHTSPEIVCHFHFFLALHAVKLSLQSLHFPL